MKKRVSKRLSRKAGVIQWAKGLQQVNGQVQRFILQQVQKATCVALEVTLPAAFQLDQLGTVEQLFAALAPCQEDAALLEQFAQPRHAETQFVVVQGIRAQAVLTEPRMAVGLFHLAAGEHQGAAAEGRLGIAQQHDAVRSKAWRALFPGACP